MEVALAYHRMVSRQEPEKHSRLVKGGRAYWLTERLWLLSRNLPVSSVSIDSIPEFDQDCWFGGRPATCRAVAEHARRIINADLSHPVILSADGRLMDGGHRLAKASIEGRVAVNAVRFDEDPVPDYVVEVDDRG